jgi:hypothetical protein
LKALQELRVLKVPLELQESKAIRAIKVIQKALQEHLVFKVNQVVQAVLQDLREQAGLLV